MIPSTSIVHPLAKIGEGVVIGPFCLIGPNVTIGDRTRLEGYVSIGTPPEHRDYFEKFGHVEIGSDCFIREFVTINSGSKAITKVGNNVIMMKGVHIGHDCQIEDNVTMACNCLLAGHSHIMKYANLGLGVVVHQYSVIGSYSMTGMSSVITKKTLIRPCEKWVGNPARKIGMNNYAINMHKLTETDEISEGIRQDDLCMHAHD